MQVFSRSKVADLYSSSERSDRSIKATSGTAFNPAARASSSVRAQPMTSAVADAFHQCRQRIGHRRLRLGDQDLKLIPYRMHMPLG